MPGLKAYALILAPAAALMALLFYMVVALRSGPNAGGLGILLASPTALAPLLRAALVSLVSIHPVFVAAITAAILLHRIARLKFVADLDQYQNAGAMGRR